MHLLLSLLTTPFIFFECLQKYLWLDRSYRFPPTDSLQCVLIDSALHELPLGNFCDTGQLLVVRNNISFRPVLNGFEFQQAQIFTFLPVPVGFFSEVNGQLVCNYGCALQQAARVKPARLSVRSKALRFGMVLVPVQQRAAQTRRCCELRLLLLNDFILVNMRIRT